MRKLPTILFMLLFVMAVVSGYNSYCAAAKMIESDMQQALAKAMTEKGIEAMRQDSIRAYSAMAKNSSETVTITVADAAFRSHLLNDTLRDNAFLAYTVGQKDGRWIVEVNTHTSCTAGMIWDMSDQRLSFLFSLMAMLCLAISLRRNRYNEDDAVADQCAVVEVATAEATCFGGIRYDESVQQYVTLDGVLIHLTPMQLQLMQMFMAAESHRLTKEEICGALWPKKDDASETLYTMIRRLKRELEQHTTLHIQSDRGRAYTLTE